MPALLNVSEGTEGHKGHLRVTEVLTVPKSTKASNIVWIHLPPPTYIYTHSSCSAWRGYGQVCPSTGSFPAETTPVTEDKSPPSCSDGKWGAHGSTGQKWRRWCQTKTRSELNNRVNFWAGGRDEERESNKEQERVRQQDRVRDRQTGNDYRAKSKEKRGLYAGVGLCGSASTEGFSHISSGRCSPEPADGYLLISRARREATLHSESAQTAAGILITTWHLLWMHKTHTHTLLLPCTHL